MTLDDTTRAAIEEARKLVELGTPDIFKAGFLAGLNHARSEGGEAVTILEETADFLETVLQWTGSDEDELHEAQDRIRRFLSSHNRETS